MNHRQRLGPIPTELLMLCEIRAHDFRAKMQQSNWVVCPWIRRSKVCRSTFTSPVSLCCRQGIFVNLKSIGISPFGRETHLLNCRVSQQLRFSHFPDPDQAVPAASCGLVARGSSYVLTIPCNLFHRKSYKGQLYWNTKIPRKSSIGVTIMIVAVPNSGWRGADDTSPFFWDRACAICKQHGDKLCVRTNTVNIFSIFS